MNIYFTGNRIQDLGGFTKNKLQTNIESTIRNIIGTLNPKSDIILTSLSLGIETWAAEIALQHKIPYHVYVPFEHYHSKWIKSSQSTYLNLVKYASKIIQISTKGFSVESLKETSNLMVTNCDMIYSFFNEHVFLFRQAEKLNKQIINLMPYGEDNDYHITI